MTRLLVIEDEVEIRANLLEFLSLEGYETFGADNGVQGLVGALEYEPDLILCDVMMPELDGYEVLQAVRKEPRIATTPFIFLTALADKGDLRQGMQLGADDYLTKPFIFSEVASAIEVRLEKQATLTAQQTTEHQQLLAIQQEMNALKEVEKPQAELITEVRKQLKQNLIQLSSIDVMLTETGSEFNKASSLAIIQKVCRSHVRMLAEIPSFECLFDDLSETAPEGHLVTR